MTTADGSRGVPPATTTGMLLDEAERLGLRRLWVHRSAAERVNWAPSPGWNAQARDSRVHAWRPVHGYYSEARDLFDARECGRRVFANATPAELFSALALLEQLTGIAYGPSPEATASRLLVRVHAGANGKALEPVDMPPPALNPTTERDWLWERPTRPRGAAVVALDVNAAYLAAASSLRAGCGQLVRNRLSAFRDPGYYLATIAAPRGLALPSPFPRDRAWVTAPTLQLAHQVGALVEVHESYVWEDSSRPLEPWYRVLRSARSHLMESDAPGARLALRAVKLMYGPFLGGRVASSNWDRTGDPLHRPDWRHAIIATTRANLYRHLLALPAEWRRRLWAVATDALYFVTPDVDSLPPLPIDDGAGHFKVLWVRAIADLAPARGAVLSTLRGVA